MVCYNCGEGLKIENFYFNPLDGKVKLCPRCFDYFIEKIKEKRSRL